MNALPNSKPPQAARNNALEACIDRIDGLGLDPGRDSLLLAVSGGPDSMAMASAFAVWRQRHAPSMRIGALVVDHGLRPGSGGEAGMVGDRLRSLGIGASVARVGGVPPRRGIQAWARLHRYRLLVRAAAPGDAAVVTAHHAGDQAETVLMRARRGSGLAGLSGMARESSVDGVRLLRPFLDLDPGTLRASLAGAGLPAVDDPSNGDRRFERVRVRWELAASGTGPLLCRLADAASRLNGALQKGIGAAMAGKAGLSASGHCWVDCEAFAALPDTAAAGLLSLMIRAMATAPHPVGREALARLAGTLRRGREATLGGCEWRISGAAGDRRIVCLAEAGRLPPSAVADGGFHLFDRRWQVSVPGEFSGRLEAIGAGRFAALRRMCPDWEPPRGIPARAFWRIPVLVNGPGSRSDAPRNGAMALDDSTLVPHVVGYRNGSRTVPDALPWMRFVGGRSEFRRLGF